MFENFKNTFSENVVSFFHCQLNVITLEGAVVNAFALSIYRFPFPSRLCYRVRVVFVQLIILNLLCFSQFNNSRGTEMSIYIVCLQG
jgi:hypothetical protein